MNLFSTEQVTMFHPDKYADQISDAILTECLRQDKNSHCGIETLVKNDTVVISGEITTAADVNYDEIVRRVAKKLNYPVGKIINLISKQSSEINGAVMSDENFGAGDQGIMFGYATNETPNMLPFGFNLANTIVGVLEDDARFNKNTILKGDAKVQVTVDLDCTPTIESVKAILISVCTVENCDLEYVRAYVKNLIKQFNFNTDTELIINPSGVWTIGGPVADCGLTGRKIVCDQYGGYCAVGGGAFSGKDPTKVDRSASYMARVIACDLVKEFNLQFCQVQLGYAIGKSEPMNLCVTSNSPEIEDMLISYINGKYDLTPKGIINYLNLYEWDFENLAQGCHYRHIFEP